MKTIVEMIDTMAYDEEKSKRFAAYVGAMLRKEREKSNMTTHHLSVLTGKSESCIYKIEHGTTKPSFETMVCICQAMDLEIELFIPSESEINKISILNDE